MNDKFDELARNMGQSVTRRGALKKFGAGIAGVVLALLGLENNAKAGPGHCKVAGERCEHSSECCSNNCVSFSEPAKHSFCGP